MNAMTAARTHFQTHQDMYKWGGQATIPPALIGLAAAAVAGSDAGWIGLTAAAFAGVVGWSSKGIHEQLTTPIPAPDPKAFTLSQDRIAAMTLGSGIWMLAGIPALVFQ